MSTSLAVGLQGVAICCSLLQCVSVCCSAVVVGLGVVCMSASSSVNVSVLMGDVLVCASALGRMAMCDTMLGRMGMCNTNPQPSLFRPVSISPPLSLSLPLPPPLPNPLSRTLSRSLPPSPSASASASLFRSSILAMAHRHPLSRNSL